MSTPEERKLELERKKQRLAEIREVKKQREEQKRNQLLAHKADFTGGRTSPMKPSDSEMEKILSEVGISSQPTPTVALTEATPDSPALSIRGSDKSFSGSPRASPHKALFAGNTVKMEAFTKSETVQVNIPPKEHVAYEKTTQTDVDAALGFREFHTGSNEWFEDSPLAGGSQAGTPGDGPSAVEVFIDPNLSPTHQLAGILPHISLVRPTEVPAKMNKRRPTAPDLTEEEKQRILTSNDFQDFFARSTKIIERALTEEVDIFVDYSRGPEDQEKVDSTAKVSMTRCFFDEKWSKGRCVSCLDWSPQHPELIVASYNNNEDQPHEPAGVVLVWNTKFKKDSPEYVFYAQSRVTSVAFARFHPNLILGGTYSGQICLWDNRQNKKTPVQRSPLSTSAHTHPVYSLKVVGTQNAHNLISVSTDGKMCSWSLDMLAHPQESLELSWAKQNRQVAATCISFPLHDVNNFFIGSEDGVLYSACRHGTKAGIVSSHEGHYAPITGVSCHSALGQVDFSELVLTSSFDWTVKLWNAKEAKAVHSFEDHNDYVYDVAWSPTHPALFACVDGQGRMELWNLNQDTELPAAVVFVEGRPALNKVMWLPSGQQLAVGDNKGSVWLYDVNESVANPKADEWQRLTRTLMDIKQATEEAEELSQAMALSETK